MAELSFQERRIIEAELIQGGYVLNFTDRTFQEFVADVTGLDINEQKYYEGNSGSKGNRLKAFIRLEKDYTVGKLLSALYDEIVLFKKQAGVVKSIAYYEPYHKLCDRLRSGKIVEAIDSIMANNDDKDFHQLSKLIKESIEKNEPEAALDRLHTFLIKFLKELCEAHKVIFSKGETVNALYGKYIKAIRDKGFIESDMADKIIKFTFQIMDAFNDVRNNNSFAHDNPVLNYDESVLIFNNVTATVRFIQAIEAKHKNELVAEVKSDWGGF